MTKAGMAEKNKGIFVTKVPRENIEEAFITIPALHCEKPEHVWNRLNNYLRENPKARIVKMTVFGSADFIKENHSFQNPFLDNASWPVTWVGSHEGSRCPLAGIQVHMVKEAPVKTIKADGQIIGTVFEDSYARYCLLGNVLPDNAGANRKEQTEQVFRKWKSALEQAGMGMCDIVRTWLFLDNILAWYAKLNKVRNDFFSREGVYDGIVPASTGVSGCHPMGTALATELIAVQSKSDGTRMNTVPSSLQCPAWEYGSAFSRAVELSTPRQKRLFISGTACISPDGNTLHKGDVKAQIEVTMRVVKAILETREMDWPDVSRAIAYFKKSEDMPYFSGYCEENNILLPVIVTQADICREDLLFEIELDSVTSDQVERVFEV